jgi:DNA-binding transcriptional regulator PaaX
MTKMNAKTASKTAGSAERKRPGRKSKGAAPRKTKATLMREMLEGEGGASLDDLCKATGWQPHTVRAALSGLRKAGHAIDRTRDDAGKSIYRVTATGGAT